MRNDKPANPYPVGLRVISLRRGGDGVPAGCRGLVVLPLAFKEGVDREQTIRVGWYYGVVFEGYPPPYGHYWLCRHNDIMPLEDPDAEYLGDEVVRELERVV